MTGGQRKLGMHIRNLTKAAILVAAASLTLAACGGNSGSDNDRKIEGAANGTSESPSASASPAVAGGPRFDLPADVTVDIDGNLTSDKAKDAILRDHGYALTSMQEGYARRSPTPNFKRYWSGPAFTSYANDFSQYANAGLTIAGRDHFYLREVKTYDAQRAIVTFCEDQSKAFDKEVKSGKVLRTAPDSGSFRFHRNTLNKNSKGDWQVTASEWTKGSEKCRSGA
jgi:hypothetical protein